MRIRDTKAHDRLPPLTHKCFDCMRTFTSKYALKTHRCPKDSTIGLALVKAGYEL